MAAMEGDALDWEKVGEVLLWEYYASFVIDFSFMNWRYSCLNQLNLKFGDIVTEYQPSHIEGMR